MASPRSPTRLVGDLRDPTATTSGLYEGITDTAGREAGPQIEMIRPRNSAGKSVSGIWRESVDGHGRCLLQVSSRAQGPCSSDRRVPSNRGGPGRRRSCRRGRPPRPGGDLIAAGRSEGTQTTAPHVVGVVQGGAADPVPEHVDEQRVLGVQVHDGMPVSARGMRCGDAISTRRHWAVGFQKRRLPGGVGDRRSLSIGPQAGQAGCPKGHVTTDGSHRGRARRVAAGRRDQSPLDDDGGPASTESAMARHGVGSRRHRGGRPGGAQSAADDPPSTCPHH